MKIETATYFGVLSEKCIDEYFKQWRVDKTCIRLVTYEQNPMKPLGQLKDLKKIRQLKLFCVARQHKIIN